MNFIPTELLTIVFEYDPTYLEVLRNHVHPELMFLINTMRRKKIFEILKPILVTVNFSFETNATSLTRFGVMTRNEYVSLVWNTSRATRHKHIVDAFLPYYYDVTDCKNLVDYYTLANMVFPLYLTNLVTERLKIS